MSKLIDILEGKSNGRLNYRERFQGLNAKDLEITDEVFNVLAREIAPLMASPEGKFYRFRDILQLAEPILQNSSLAEIPQERRESVRRVLFGSPLEQQGLDRGKFYAEMQRVYNSYCNRVESLEALQKRLIPEFDEFHPFYHMDLMDYPHSNLKEAERTRTD